MKGKMRGNFYNKKKIGYLNMIAGGKDKKNSRGDVVKSGAFQNSKSSTAHIESSRSWFNDTKTVTQNDLEEYRNNIRVKNPYEVLLSTGNVPYSMINNEVKLKKDYSLKDCFGTKSQPKKPKISYKSLTEMVEASSRMKKSLEQEKSGERKKEHVAGQSHRIWNELYKVLDSSDVVVHVLDARDPIGTKCNQIVDFINNEAKHKHLIYVLNKVDLVPTSVTAKWLRVLSKERPTIAYHSNSLDNNYGKNNLISLLRQLKTLYDKPSVSVGFVGYPNTGKSSIINTLRDKNVCKTAPVPGETKVWQYITLVKDLYLVDSPGVVPVPDFKQAVLKGAIRIENVDDPDVYVRDIIEKAGKDVVEKTYNMHFTDIEEFFLKMSQRLGKIGKNGRPNVDLISKIVLHDWLRGRIPYYTLPEGETMG